MEGWARETSLWDGSPHRIWDSAGVFPGPYRICLTWATYHSLRSNGELLPWPAPRSQVRPWRRMENYLWQMTLKREGVAHEVVHLTYSPTTGGIGRSCLGHSCLKETWGGSGVGGSYCTHCPKQLLSWAKRGASPMHLHVTQVLGCLLPRRGGHFFPVSKETPEGLPAKWDSFPRRHT